MGFIHSMDELGCLNLIEDRALEMDSHSRNKNKRIDRRDSILPKEEITFHVVKVSG